MKSVKELENIITQSTYMFSFAFSNNIVEELFPKGLKMYLDLEEERFKEIITSHIIKYFEKEFNNKKLSLLFDKYISSRGKKEIDASDFILFDELLSKMEYQLSFDDVSSITNKKIVEKYLDKGISQDILNNNIFLNQIYEFYSIQIDEEHKTTTVDEKNITIDDNMKLYNNDCKLYKLLTADEEKYYATKYRETKDKDALDILVGSNQGLVKKEAYRFVNRGVALLDLIQEGNIGLMKAIEKFDPTLGYKFSTYATWWIDQNIRRSIHELSRTIRVPLHLSERFNKLSRIESALTQELYREPTNEEILEAWNKNAGEKEKMTLYRIKEMRAYKENITPVSLNKLVADDDSEFGDFIENESIESPVEYAERREIIELMNKLLNELSCFSSENKNKRAAQMLRMYEGMFNDETRMILKESNKSVEERRMTLSEISEVYNITGERVRQLLKKTKRSIYNQLTKIENEVKDPDEKIKYKRSYKKRKNNQ